MRGICVRRGTEWYVVVFCERQNLSGDNQDKRWQPCKSDRQVGRTGGWHDVMLFRLCMPRQAFRYGGTFIPLSYQFGPSSATSPQLI